MKSVKQTHSALAVTLSAALLSTVSALGLTAQAQEFVKPTPASVAGAETTGFGREGLHRMRFTVKADGSVADPEVIGGFTNPMAAQFLTQSIQGWTFNPGTVDGEPADYFNQEFVIYARLGQELSVSPGAQTAFDEVNTLIQEEDYKKALRELDKLISGQVVTVLDYTLAHELKATILTRMDEHFAALEAAKIATMSRRSSTGETEYFLPPAMLDPALRRRFLLAATVGQNIEALRAYDILDANFDLQPGDPIIDQGATIREIVEQPQVVSRGAIVDKQWSYTPRYRYFEVSDVDGRISRINVRCDRRQLMELKFEENTGWQLPEAWGDCMLEFVGRDGTEFNLFELAD